MPFRPGFPLWSWSPVALPPQSMCPWQRRSSAVSTPKPHRRLSLTQPTSAAVPEETLSPAATGARPKTNNGGPPAVGDESPSAPKEERQTVVRVMAYLTQEEGEALDELWYRCRRLPA